MSPSKKILIGISGSIAAFKIASVISYFKKAGWEIRVIATPSALKFIGEATLEGLSGHAVLTSDFTPGHMMSHIDLARWADVFLIAPATAKTLAGLATGAGDGILHSTYLAYETHKPVLVAPAMNSQMLSHPATQSALRTLRARGTQLLQTDAGLLACGETGDGRMMEPENIIIAVEQATLSVQKTNSVLITMGGTRVPIDQVRAITNTSTGKTGALLADTLLRKGYDVTVIAAKSALKPRLVKKCFLFDTFDDLKVLLESKLNSETYNTIVHMAAVSDFTLPAPMAKIPSGQPLELRLQPTPKLITMIRKLAPQSHLIGFKLTVDASPETVEKSVDSVFNNGADAVIHNDLSQISSTAHKLTLYVAGRPFASTETAEGLASLVESSTTPTPKQQNSIAPEVTL